MAPNNHAVLESPQYVAVAGSPNVVAGSPNVVAVERAYVNNFIFEMKFSINEFM